MQRYHGCMDSSDAPLVPSREPAEDQVGRFCDAGLKRGLSKNTIKNYRSDLKGAIRWFSERTGSPLVWSDFFLRDVDDYRQFLCTTVRRTTANRKLAGLRAFLKWLAQEIDTWQSASVHSEPLPEVRRIISEPGRWARPRWLTVSEQATLNQTVQESGNLKDRAIIALFLYTGIRTSQLGKLRWSDFLISRERGRMAIYRPTYGDYAEIPLNQLVRQTLVALGYAEYRGSSRPVFMGKSGPMSRRRIEMMVRRYGEGAYIFDLTPLVLRNTFIANMLDFGVNPVIISDILGDPVLDLLRYYAPPEQEDLENAVEKIVYAVLGQERYRIQKPRGLFPAPPNEGS